MENIQLEMRLSDKILSVNGKEIKLDDSLFYAGTGKVLNRENEKALELKYHNLDEGFIDDEVSDMHDFLEELELTDRIDLNWSDDKYPTIALVGEYKATIYD